MSLRFDGQVALVTGAGRGIGRAYCEWLSARGAKVVVNNRVHADQPSAARVVAQAIADSGGAAIADEHAVDDEAGCRAMVQAALDAFGRLDILICNAAISGLQHAAELDVLDIGAFRRMMDINFWGSVMPLMAALPHMYARNYGRIVLTSSAAGLYGQRGGAHYGASKTALIGVVRALLLESAKRKADIKANIVVPYAKTDMTRSIPPHLADLMAPRQVAKVTGWLCSDQCTRNGDMFAAGGGRIRRVVIAESKPLDLTGEDLSALMPLLDGLDSPQISRNAADSSFGLVPELLAGRP
jgi:NAD(P)-dependent dehydrogenase (short-subunit alcohol dehydrogenase family)